MAAFTGVSALAPTSGSGTGYTGPAAPGLFTVATWPTRSYSPGTALWTTGGSGAPPTTGLLWPRMRYS